MPPSRIAELADHTRMTDHGRRLFYVHKPQLNDREAFNNNCSGYEQTIVLGCYITHTAIYIFDVTDPRLEGVEEVTAAHEMLHAAYDRLSSAERKRIDVLAQNYFDRLNDERLKKVVNSYHVRDASSVANELHSILGTEVRELPKELEDYYARYFEDRQAVVGFSERYEAIFTEQKNRIQILINEIEELEKQLAAQRQVISRRESELMSSGERLNELRDSGRIEEYNAAVPAYNRQVNDYRGLIADYNAKVKQFNQLIEEHNSLAIEQRKLINSISSQQEAL